MPPLLTALAYEAIFGKPVAELFGGTYAPIREEIMRRATLLAEKLNAGELQVHESRKGSIQAIATRQ